jgi:hypothetical protein
MTSNIKFLRSTNLLDKKKLTCGTRDLYVEVPTMDDRQEIDLKSSVPVKRKYMKM